MKVCIVTVYSSINSGSYWQAKALADYIQNLGHDVYFLERRDPNYTKKQQIFSIIKKCIKLDFRRAITNYRSYKRFLARQKTFSIIKYSELKSEKFDCIILGSDTIWNLNSKFFTENRDVFWGGIFEEPIITYAASIANTSVETMLKYPELKDMVTKWSDISVRDLATKQAIEKYANKKVYVVADPTLLFPDSYYKCFINIKRNNKFIFLYLFQALSEKMRKELQSYAKKNSLLIINGVGLSNYCDENIVNDPYGFINHVVGADLIITDTFHGVVFSTNLHKQFIAINRGKNKVSDFLNSVGLQNRIVEENENICSVLAKPIDYDLVSDAVERIRERSRSFLKTALGNIYDKNL